MEFRQFYLGCLAHASYLIASDGEALIVDPQRDVDLYIDEAARLGVGLRYIIETHLHADFVSGHKELAERTGAEIVIGRLAEAEFPHKPVSDGDELRVGKVILRALETPGHTPEGICWVVMDEEDETRAVKVLTGDTLFIGDVGRPDLAGSRGYSSQAMAGMLYDSLHQKLLALPDDVEVWPAHGAGSMCGRKISRETSSTIGIQRSTNYALRPMSREDFIASMTSDLSPAPSYFAMDAEINRKGAGRLSDIVAAPLSPSNVQQRIQDGATILDVRDATAFGAAHLPGSVNIGLGGQFASWAGTLLSPADQIIIVAATEEESRQAIMRLARVGLENARGWLDGGIDAWQESGFITSSIQQMSVEQLHSRFAEKQLQVVDVRGENEFSTGHVPGALHIPLSEVRYRRDEIDHSRPTAVICGSGYRSSAAASLIFQNEDPGVFNVAGGTSAWTKAGFALEAAGDNPQSM